MGPHGLHELPPTVCAYVRVYACMRGPWHGAQLGGPIPLTRSQHPSLAIIPLGGSLAKDLIKYCYTRNLIPLGYVPSPVSARYSLPLTPAPVSPSCRRTAQECAIRRATRQIFVRTRGIPCAEKSRCLRRYLSRARVPYLRRVSFWIVQVDLKNIPCERLVQRKINIQYIQLLSLKGILYLYVLLTKLLFLYFQSFVAI